MQQTVTTLGRASLRRALGHLRAPIYGTGYALLLSSALTSGLGLLYWVLAARHYSLTVVGLNSAAIATLTLLEAIARLQLDGALVRFLPRAGRDAPRLVAGIYAVTVAAAIVVGLGYVGAVMLWPALGDLFSWRDFLLLWFTPALVIWVVFNLQDYVLIGVGKAGWIPLENGVFALVKIALLVLFAGRAPNIGIFLSWTVAPMVLIGPINLIAFGWLLPRHVRATAQLGERINWRQVRRYASGEAFGSFFGLAAATLPPLMVAYRLGPEQNAYFYVPWIMMGALALVTANMATSLVVEAARAPERLYSFTRQTLLHILRLLTPTVLAVMVAAGFVLHLLGAQYADQGANLLRLLVLVTLPSAFVFIYMSMLRVQRRMRWFFVVQSLISGSELLLGFLLLPVFGIMGIGVAVLGVQLAAAIVLCATALRPVLRRQPPPWHEGGAETPHNAVAPACQGK